MIIIKDDEGLDVSIETEHIVKVSPRKAVGNKTLADETMIWMAHRHRVLVKKSVYDTLAMIRLATIGAELAEDKMRVDHETKRSSS